MSESVRQKESAIINQALIDLDKSLFVVTLRSLQALRACWRSDNSLRSGFENKKDIQGEKCKAGCDKEM